MQLYLVRHGLSVHPTQDRARPLSPEGRDQIDRLAAWMKSAGVRVRQILHSPKQRAVDTAEILMKTLDPPKGRAATPGLRPDDSPDAAADGLRFEPEPLLVVTHLPLIDLLASRLVTGRATPGTLIFRTGSAVCLAGGGDDWAVEWFVSPEFLPTVA